MRETRIIFDVDRMNIDVINVLVANMSVVLDHQALLTKYTKAFQ